MQPEAILETSLYARDLDAAESFYTAVLGLAPYSKVPGRHVFFRCGSAMLLIFNPETTATTTASPIPPHGAIGPGHVCFRAEPGASIEDWRARLAETGTVIEAEITWPKGGCSLYFRDPAGNSLEIAEPGIWGLA